MPGKTPKKTPNWTPSRPQKHCFRFRGVAKFRKYAGSKKSSNKLPTWSQKGTKIDARRKKYGARINANSLVPRHGGGFAAGIWI